MATARMKGPRADGPVGNILRHWRSARRMSQLDLAHAAQVSPRHVSFVESGRATPSREMINTLAVALDIPLRERNDLLLAAGYAPAYRETPVAAPEMAQIRGALDRALAQHEPYPAVVIDRHWTIMRTNRAADAMFGWLLGDQPTTAGPANVIRLMFDPVGLRPFVANWEQVGPALLQRMHREAIGGVPDAATAALLTEVTAQPGVPLNWREPDVDAVVLPVVPVTFAKRGLTVSYFSMITTVGTPQDITAQEIRIEAFYPVDPATDRHHWS
jgi:transcriptional regulator with XRE-family HTH domain